MPIYNNKNIYFQIDRTINKNHLTEYCAVLIYEEGSKPNYYIRVVEKDANIIESSNSKLFHEIQTEKILKDYKIYPLPNMNKDVDMRRTTVYSVGVGGSGKTYLAMFFASLYHQLYPDNKIFYFTCNPAKNDPSIDKFHMEDIIERIDVRKFSLEWYGINEKGMLYDEDSPLNNSLQIFDDLDVLDGEERKMMWKYITFTNESLRKLDVSSYVMSHSPSDGRITAKFLKELKIYVIYPSLNFRACQNDRVLYHYLKYKASEIYNLCNLPSRWVWINETKRIVITENQIFPSSSL